MSNELVGLVIILLMFVLLMLRIPVAIAMLFPAMIGILYLRNIDVLINVIDSTIMNHALSFIMTTIALFVMMGELMNASGISSQLYQSFKMWFGKFRGGLAIATVSAGSIFAASSGSSIATTASLGTISTKEMLKSNYGKVIAGGSILAGGSLGVLIPPSTFMVLYGVLAQQHIGKLLIAGILPGIILTVLYILTIMIYVRISPSAAAKEEKAYPLAERLKSLTSVIPVFLLFFFVIGGLYIGIFGPTEAGAMGAFGALVIALLSGKLTFQKAKQVLVQTFRTVGFMFAILLSALILNSFIVQSGLPALLNQFLLSLDIHRIFIFMIIVLIYIVLGAFMDALAAMLVTFPIILPLVEMLGYDLIWFGVVMVILMEMALITPPLGMSSFILNGVAPELGLSNIFKGALIFCIPILVLILLIYLFPDLVFLLADKL